MTGSQHWAPVAAGPGVGRRARGRAVLLQRLLRRRRPAAGHLRGAQAAAVATPRRHQRLRRGVPQRRGARDDAAALRRSGVPRPGLPGDEARRPDRRAVDHRAQRRSPDRPLGDRRGWRCRAGPHRLLRRRGTAAADSAGAAVRRGEVARPAPGPAGGPRRAARGTLTLRAWLRWVQGPKAHAIWSPRDPRPFVWTWQVPPAPASA